MNDFPETSRISSETLFKNPVKITQIIKTALITDLRNLAGGIQEQLGGIIQTVLVDILNNGPLGRLLINMTKMLAAQPELLCQLRELKRPSEIRFHHFPNGGDHLFMRGIRLFGTVSAYRRGPSVFRSFRTSDATAWGI